MTTVMTTLMMMSSRRRCTPTDDDTTNFDSIDDLQLDDNDSNDDDFNDLLSRSSDEVSSTGWETDDGDDSSIDGDDSSIENIDITEWDDAQQSLLVNNNNHNQSLLSRMPMIFMEMEKSTTDTYMELPYLKQEQTRVVETNREFQQLILSSDDDSIYLQIKKQKDDIESQHLVICNDTIDFDQDISSWSRDVVCSTPASPLLAETASPRGTKLRQNSSHSSAIRHVLKDGANSDDLNAWEKITHGSAKMLHDRNGKKESIESPGSSQKMYRLICKFEGRRCNRKIHSDGSWIRPSSSAQKSQKQNVGNLIRLFESKPNL